MPIDRVHRLIDERREESLEALGVLAGAIRACRGVDPQINLSSGGSLPNAVWPTALGVDHIQVPYANADENNHSPNENLSLERFQDGIHVSAQVFEALAGADAERKLPRRSPGGSGQGVRVSRSAPAPP